MSLRKLIYYNSPDTVRAGDTASPLWSYLLFDGDVQVTLTDDDVVTANVVDESEQLITTIQIVNRISYIQLPAASGISDLPAGDYQLDVHVKHKNGDVAKYPTLGYVGFSVSADAESKATTVLPKLTVQEVYNSIPVEVKNQLASGNFKGATGESAYELAKDNGFAGTEKEWLESLKAKPDPTTQDLNAAHLGTDNSFIGNNTFRKLSVTDSMQYKGHNVMTDDDLNFYMPTVKEYGAKGDGTTDDTAAIQKAVYANADGALAFPPGIYSLSEPINISESCALHFYGSTIKASKAMSALFYTDGHKPASTLNGIALLGDWATVFDLNGLASVGVRAGGVVIDNICFNDLPNNAIGIKVDGFARITNVTINNTSDLGGVTGTIGVQLNMSDSRISHITTVNIETGIEDNVGGNIIDDFHPWSVAKPEENNTVGIRVKGDGTYLGNFYCDTCAHCVEIIGKAMVVITTMTVFWNLYDYNDNVNSPVPYLFYFKDIPAGYTGENVLLTNTLDIHSAGVKGQVNFWSNLPDNSGFGLSNVKISSEVGNRNGIDNKFLV